MIQANQINVHKNNPTLLDINLNQIYFYSNDICQEIESSRFRERTTIELR